MENKFVFRTICEIPEQNAAKAPSRISHRFRSGAGFAQKTWLEFWNDIKSLSCGFRQSGMARGTHTAFFADNRYEWSLTDYSLLACGSVSVPRGSDTSPIEQKFLYIHSDSSFLVMENSSHLADLMKEFTPDELPLIKKVFLMDRTQVPVPAAVADRTVFFDDIMRIGAQALAADAGAYAAMVRDVKGDDLASIVYTSGTSGNPKGVMLTHNNFLHNIRAITPLLWIDVNDPNEKTVSILPSWHVYERCYEFCTASGLVTIVYSSIKNLAEDLVNEKPTLVCSVPRVWESVYAKIKNKIDRGPAFKKVLFYYFMSFTRRRLLAMNVIKGHINSDRRPTPLIKFANMLYVAFIQPIYLMSKLIFKPVTSALGGRLRASFSGGGSLPYVIDTFFNSTGVRLVNAYGMTETSPGTITRRLDRNTIGTIGVPLAETEVRVVKEEGRSAWLGEKGVIYVRGPQVMKGYYKNPEATREILSPDGWLNTGDIGYCGVNGDYVMTGRAKSTIVLLGGENLEPEPIEEKLQESDLIDHAVVMGQDKKGLVAVIAVNEEKLKHLAEKWKVSMDDLVHKGTDIIKHAKFTEHAQKEIKRLINRDTGFKPFESIQRFILTTKKFAVGDELTQTLKVKRKHVEKKYKHLIDMPGQNHKDEPKK